MREYESCSRIARLEARIGDRCGVLCENRGSNRERPLSLRWLDEGLPFAALFHKFAEPTKGSHH